MNTRIGNSAAFYVKLVRTAIACAICLASLNLHSEVSKSVFGTTADGQTIEIFTLRDGAIRARVMTYGARLVSLEVPDRNDKSADIVLGYDSLQPYLNDQKTFFGGIIGRFANRIANAAFVLNGVQYHLSSNSGHNSLHGGYRGFDKCIWSGRIIPHGVELRLVSKNGDEGYPGTLRVRVRYTLNAHTLRIDYFATADADTVINLTNHSYFNLAGEGSGNVLDHIVSIAADYYTPTNADQIPTGQIAPVAGTPFDFRAPSRIGSRINQDDDQIRYGKGYDINFVLRPSKASGVLHDAARVMEPKSGRIMVVRTTQPGLQFNSGNLFDGSIHGKHGHSYGKYASFCLEPQHFPDSPHHPNFPSTELRAGQTFHEATEYRFLVDH